MWAVRVQGVKRGKKKQAGVDTNPFSDAVTNPSQLCPRRNFFFVNAMEDSAAQDSERNDESGEKEHLNIDPALAAKVRAAFDVTLSTSGRLACFRSPSCSFVAGEMSALSGSVAPLKGCCCFAQGPYVDEVLAALAVRFISMGLFSASCAAAAYLR